MGGWGHVLSAMQDKKKPMLRVMGVEGSNWI